MPPPTTTTSASATTGISLAGSPNRLSCQLSFGFRWLSTKAMIWAAGLDTRAHLSMLILAGCGPNGNLGPQLDPIVLRRGYHG